ncbi:glycerol-3-phosphate dehydrogenase, partial [Microbacterium esteraromaticum]
GRAIGGGNGFPRTARARHSWIEQNLAGAGERAERLLTRYGTHAADVWQFITSGDDAPLAGGDLSTRELAWMVEREHAVRLQDVVLRRTSLAFTGDVDTSTLVELADAMAPLLGWDADRRAAELDDTRALLNERHGLELPALPSHQND